MANRFFSNLFSEFGGGERPRSFLSRDTFAPSYQDEQEESSPMDFFSYRPAETKALSAYRQHLSSQPQYEDYRKTNLTNKIGAALAGLSAGAQGGDAYSATRGHLDIPWERALYDYNLKGQGLREQAQMEANDNENAYRYWNAGQKAYQDYLEHNRKVTKDEADMRNDSLRTQNDTARTRQQGQYYEGQINLGQRRNELTSEANRNLAGYRSGMLGVAQRNAGTNEKRANAYSSYLQSRQQSQGAGKTPSIRDQDFAEQVELGRLVNDPAWKDYIISAGQQTDDSGNPIGIPRYIVSPNAPAFIKSQLQDRIRSRFSQGYDVYGDEDNSPYAIEEVPDFFSMVPSH